MKTSEIASRIEQIASKPFDIDRPRKSPEQERKEADIAARATATELDIFIDEMLPQTNENKGYGSKEISVEGGIYAITRQPNRLGQEIVTMTVASADETTPSVRMEMHEDISGQTSPYFSLEKSDVYNGRSEKIWFDANSTAIDQEVLEQCQLLISVAEQDTRAALAQPEVRQAEAVVA